MERDAELKERVTDELLWDANVDPDDITATVQDGIATLIGTVHSYAAKIAAQDAAHRVSGVRDVANDIQVVPTNSRTDTEIAEAVRAALEWDVLVPHREIQTTVSNGWVSLDGAVEQYLQREDAEYAIRRLEGVRGVTNNIRVEPGAAIPERAHEAILTALRRQAGREADRVEIANRDGHLVLTGSVHSWAERRAVVGAAGHLPGVRSVADLLEVEPFD